MAKFKFHVGDKVFWSSEAGKSEGQIKAIMTKQFSRTGKTGKVYVHHPTPDDPQYKIKSLKTDHIAYHKGKALHKLK